MSDRNKEGIYADRVQLAYAKTLDYVSHAVMLAMAAGYIVYMLQLLPLEVPVETIAGNWHLSASAMQAKLHPSCGWSCFSSLTALLHGDAVSYASVIFLALATLICLASAAAVFFSEKKHLFLAITMLQVLVLLVAASGIMTGSH
jgi:hypothetical protein